MGNSDSDSENECFESAEESLDESDEVKSVGIDSKKSENEVAELVSDNVESSPQLKKDVSSSSISYRKRPDRVKRSNSNSTTKPLPKLPSTDTIFKTEKIVPDAFFQDITSNLSKNINKSLSTLQQKSSNVKDLILSSLPVSSVSDGEGFSYDDTTTQMLPDESDVPIAEEESQSHSDQLIQNITEDSSMRKEESCEEGKLITETSSLVTDRLSDSNKERKPPDIGSSSQEKDSKGDFDLKGITLVENVKEKITNLTVEEKIDAVDSCKNKVDNSSHKNKMEPATEKVNEESAPEKVNEGSAPEKVNEESAPDKVNEESATEKVNKESEVSSNVISNSSCLEISQGNCNSVIKETESFLLYETNENSEIAEEPVETEVEDLNKQISHINKFSQPTEPEQLPFDDSKIISSEPKAENIKDSGSLFKDIKNESTNLSEGKVEIDSQCNLEELKTALENIVQKEIASSIKETKISEKECPKEEFISQQKKVEVNEASNDGWDDFDFSDEEVENLMTVNNDTKDTGSKHTPVDNKLAADKKISSSDNRTSSKSETKIENKSASKKDFTMQGKSNELSKKPEEVVQPEPVSDDTWDWNDSWDETSEGNKGTIGVTSTAKNEKTRDNSSDLGKWTGWDTFAQKPQEKQGNWGLGSWGMDMLLNKATAVTQGISNVLEAGLGAPDPETLARMEKSERAKFKEEEVEEPQEYSGETQKKNSLTNVNLFPVSGITSLVAGVTSKIVEHSKIQEIGSKVITGGLDTLETFGKKTMEVLQEGDPGLKNKRALLMGNNKPVLSQVLKEAREKADREMKKAEEKELAKKCHFETLFDDFQGMVHLEALEMLSRQCELKLEQIRSGMNSEEQEDLNGILEEVEQLCALDECELDLKSSVLDFKTALQMAVEPLKNEISISKIIEIHENVRQWLEMSSETEVSLVVVNQKLVSTLAELAAATVHQFHKSGELLSVKECRKTVEEVDALSRLTNILCTEINTLSEKFIVLSRNKGLTAGGDSNLNSVTEKVTVVMNNSTSYIRQAFDLLIPVLQLGAAV